MNAHKYLRVVAERWRLVTLCLLLCVGAAALVTALSPREYQARTQLFVSAAAVTDQTQLNQGNAFAQSRVKTYVALIGSPEVLAAVRAATHSQLSAPELAAKISADAPADQTIINIRGTDPAPQVAAAIANTAARTFAALVQSYETPAGSRNPSVRVIVTDPAAAPTSPVSPRPALNLALGVFVGLLVGGSAAVLRDTLDNTVKTLDELAGLAGVAPLGIVVTDPRTPRQLIANEGNARSPRAENFRHLRTSLQFADVDAQPHVIAVVSSVPAEGKSTVAANLAATMAEAGFSVCLVDADLRRPSVARYFGLVGSVGLTTVLINQVSLSEALQRVGPNLHVLASGPVPPNPSEVLASRNFRALVHGLTEKVDFVVVDTAPLLAVADGLAVASIVDGSILVARHGSTTSQQVRRSAQALARLEARLLGVVLNQVPDRQATEYGYYSSYGDAVPDLVPGLEPYRTGVEGRVGHAGHVRSGG